MKVPIRVHDLSHVSPPAFFISSASPARNSQRKAKLQLENPTASAWILSPQRRIMDLLAALSALAFLALPMLVIAILVRATSRGPAIFMQPRVGRFGHLFNIYKFRTMEASAGYEDCHGLTPDGDGRITPFGLWLRRLKLDELPQFYNILRGEMSLVGPRPKLPQFEGILNMPYRPGMTGAATLAFRNEEEMLRAVHPSQLDEYYERRIKPVKARLDVRYMCRATLRSDLRMMAATLLSCLISPSLPASVRHQSKYVFAFYLLERPAPESQ